VNEVQNAPPVIGRRGAFGQVARAEPVCGTTSKRQTTWPSFASNA
jgi:hypothetical protein